MASFDNASTKFLEQLYTLTNGDLSAQHSMHEIGAALGLNKEQSGKVAEDLIGEGLLNIKTLSGGVGITAEGIEKVQASGMQPLGNTSLSLGSGRIMETEGRTAVDNILSEIKTGIAQNPASYTQLEEMVVDIKTIETQMLSPQPKVAVIRELFSSLHAALSSVGLDNLANLIGNMIQR